jgi:hypothetical protein
MQKGFNPCIRGIGEVAGADAIIPPKQNKKMTVIYQSLQYASLQSNAIRVILALQARTGQ